MVPATTRLPAGGHLTTPRTAARTTPATGTRVQPSFITAAIDYANGDPHLGHACEKSGADAIARYHRHAGYDVHFRMGMDEHGQKVAQTAGEHGVTPQQLVDDLAARFTATWTQLGISNDQFIRTTDPAHRAGAQALVLHVYARSPEYLNARLHVWWAFLW